MSRYRNPEIDITALSDASMTLADWAKRIQDLMKEYGPGAIMYVDAGYNNVSFFIKKGPEK